MTVSLPRRRFAGALAGASLVLALSAGIALAAAGALDPSFSGDGKRLVSFPPGPSGAFAQDVVVQPNGRIILAGSWQGAADADFAVARLNPGGGLDGSFSGDGRRIVGVSGDENDAATAAALQADGRIVLAGRSTESGIQDTALTRLTSAGNLDHSFSADGKRLVSLSPSHDEASDLAIQQDGRIVVAGTANPGNSLANFAVARLNPSGGLDGSFSGDGKRTFDVGGNLDAAKDVAVQPDGKIVLVGLAYKGGANVDIAVARLNPGGGFDQTFSGDGRRTISFSSNADSGEAVAIQPNGRIVVAGSAFQGGSVNDFAVARLTATGGLDQSFAGDGRRTATFGPFNDRALDVALQANGRIVATGFFGRNPAPENNAFALARFMPGGALDSSFSGDGRQTTAFSLSGDDQAQGVAIQPNGRIVAAGYSEGKMAVARYLGG